MTEHDDEHLVAAAARGDPDAYGVLVRRYETRLYNTLLRVMNSAEDAADVCQEAFVQAFVKLDSFRGDAKFYTWLYRIAMNLALSALRRKRSTTSIDEVREKGAPDPADSGVAPPEQLLTAERAELVHLALAKLGEQSRQILVLRELEDCSYDQIAEVLDVPVGTVRSRLFRARSQLKQQLRQLMPHDSSGCQETPSESPSEPVE